MPSLWRGGVPCAEQRTKPRIPWHGGPNRPLPMRGMWVRAGQTPPTGRIIFLGGRESLRNQSLTVVIAPFLTFLGVTHPLHRPYPRGDTGTSVCGGEGLGCPYTLLHRLRSSVASSWGPGSVCQAGGQRPADSFYVALSDDGITTKKFRVTRPRRLDGPGCQGWTVPGFSLLHAVASSRWSFWPGSRSGHGARGRDTGNAQEPVDGPSEGRTGSFRLCCRCPASTTTGQGYAPDNDATVLFILLSPPPPPMSARRARRSTCR